MGFDFPGIDFPDLPSIGDLRAFAEEKATALLNYLGYEWPSTDEDTLRGMGQQWDGLVDTITAQLAELEAGVRHITTNNDGTGATAFASYLGSEESNVTALRNLAEVAPLISSGYGAAAAIVSALRLAVIAEILLDAIGLGMAIFTGGLSAGASFLIKQGAGAAIDYLLDKAVMEIIGG